MKTNPRPSLRSALDRKCKECIYDPAPGNGAWREQVAACASSNCPLFPIRPVPKDCVRNGAMVPEKIAEVRAKLEGRRS